MAENRLVDGSTFWLWLLLAVFLASLGLMATQGVRLARGRRLWPRWCDRLCCLIAIFVASVLSVDILDVSYMRHSGAERVLLSILAVAAAVAVSVLHLRHSSRSVGAAALPHICANLVLLASSGAAAYWSGQRFLDVTQPHSDVGLLVNTPGELRELQHLVAITQRGEELPLYCWAVDHDVFEYYAALEAQRNSMLTGLIIQRAPPDERANCHGWVFTGGRFLLKGRSVQAILDGNGYATTDTPRPGDLVIYRDDQRLITHTGLVRGVLDEGTVIVESKWGIGARYLHRPEDQPYSPQFEYYHRVQPQHDVSIQGKPATVRNDADPG